MTKPTNHQPVTRDTTVTHNERHATVTRNITRHSFPELEVEQERELLRVKVIPSRTETLRTRHATGTEENNPFPRPHSHAHTLAHPQSIDGTRHPQNEAHRPAQRRTGTVRNQGLGGVGDRTALRGYRCPRCGWRFLHASDLATHLIEHDEGTHR